MLSKLSALALFVPLVAGLTLNAPENPVSGGRVTITWTAAPTDSSFSLELVNTIFNNAFAIGNNIAPTDGQITLTLPVVPVGAGYTLEAVNIGNINDVYASTGTFSVGPNPSASASSTLSTSTGASATGSSVSSHAPASTSAFGTTLSAPAASSTRPASVTTGTGTGTSAVSTASGTPFNGASTLKINNQVGAFAAVALSAVAGAAVFIF